MARFYVMGRAMCNVAQHLALKISGLQLLGGT
jgi:hypothetical protein